MRLAFSRSYVVLVRTQRCARMSRIESARIHTVLEALKPCLCSSSWERVLGSLAVLPSLYSLNILVVVIIRNRYCPNRPPRTPLEERGRLTRKRGDRHSKVGLPAERDCARNRPRSGLPCSAENTCPQIRDRAQATGRPKRG